MSGNGVPSSCTYAAPLTPPTPADRPGYVFGGWKLKICKIPSGLLSTSISHKGWIGDSTVSHNNVFNPYSENTSDYGLTEDNTWGVTWSNGDKVVGEAICSAISGDSHGYAWDGNSDDWTASESELTSVSGETRYCWCKATGYIANGENQCSLSSSSWVTYYDYGANCAEECAHGCADIVDYHSGFRAALFTGVLAE